MIILLCLVTGCVHRMTHICVINITPKEKPMEPSTEEGEAKKNPPFTQVYDKGWTSLRSVVQTNTLAAEIFIFLAEHCGKDNVVICSSKVLEEEFDKSRSTIHRAIKTLEEKQCLTTIKLGTARAFCFNEELIWKSWATNKKYSLFNSKALTAKSENGHVTKRFNQMLAQGDLFDQEEGQSDYDRQTGEVTAPPAM